MVKKKKASKPRTVKPKPKKIGPGVSPISGCSPPEETRIKKGEVRNPNGFNGLTPDLEMRRLKTLTQNELKKVAGLLVQGDFNELMEFMDKNNPKRGKATVLQAMLASVVSRIITKGDMNAFDTLMNRIIGKVKDKLDLGGNLSMNTNAQVIISLPSNGREAQKQLE